MKKNIALVALIFSFVGCQNSEIDEMVAIVDDGVLRIETQYPPATRASSIGFESGDMIGVYATEYNGEVVMPLQISGNWINNEALTYDGEIWRGRRTFYWCDSGLMDVYGYYPYITPTSIDKSRWAVQTDQSMPETEGVLSGYEASDFLWAKSEGALREDGNVKLKFAHRCSKLVVKLVKGESFTTRFPDDTEVYLYSTVPSALINLAKGLVSKDPHGSPRKIKARRVSEDTFEVIVVPQSILQYSPFVEIVMGDIAYMTEEIFSYNAGVQHTVLITLENSPEKIEVDLGGTIEGWE